jgi:hypothetical protein
MSRLATCPTVFLPTTSLVHCNRMIPVNMYPYAYVASTHAKVMCDLVNSRTLPPSLKPWQVKDQVGKTVRNNTSSRNQVFLIETEIAESYAQRSSGTVSIGLLP